MNYRVMAKFEQDGETYNPGDTFALPKGWTENLRSLDSQPGTTSFTEEYTYADEATNEKKKNWRTMILPVVKAEGEQAVAEPAAPEPAAPKSRAPAKKTGG